MYSLTTSLFPSVLFSYYNFQSRWLTGDRSRLMQELREKFWMAHGLCISLLSGILKNMTPVSHKVGQRLPRGTDQSKAEHAIVSLFLHLGLVLLLFLWFFFFQSEKGTRISPNSKLELVINRIKIKNVWQQCSENDQPLIFRRVFPLDARSLPSSWPLFLSKAVWEAHSLRVRCILFCHQLPLQGLWSPLHSHHNSLCSQLQAWFSTISNMEKAEFFKFPSPFNLYWAKFLVCLCGLHQIVSQANMAMGAGMMYLPPIYQWKLETF